MTLYFNLRGSSYGAVCSPYVLEGQADVAAPAMTSVLWNAVPPLARGRDVILATHGFNVGYEAGLRSLGRLEASLAIKTSELFMGVLWPGDWILPAINYPFEDGVASKAGQLLGGFIDDWLAGARSVSMISHSLGARVVLAAMEGCSRRIRNVCIAAGAVNCGALSEEFVVAAANCDSLVTLSSLEDTVLEYAYPPGDALADVLDPDHPLFQQALGRDGPNPMAVGVRPCEIPDAPPYDHGDYLPPADFPAPPILPDTKWPRAAAFMSSVIRGGAAVWP